MNNNKIEGDLDIVSDKNFSGLVTGNVFVKNGATFTLHGLVAGDIIIEADARANIHGSVSGGIRNNGYCAIYGMVDGLIISKAENLFVENKAIVGNVINQ
jgi:hypothetical protein